MSSSPCRHRDALKNSSFFFSPSFFLLNDFKNHKKTDFPFVCKRLQKRRVKRTRPDVCTTTSSSSSSKVRVVLSSRTQIGEVFPAVARVFSSSSIGCVSLARVFFSFKLLLEEGLVFSCGVPEGPALGARRTKSRYPARTLSGLTISERAEAGTCAPLRERPSLRERERRTRRIFFLFLEFAFEFSSFVFDANAMTMSKKKLRRERGNTNNSQAGKHRTRCQIMETRDGSSECI